MRSVSVYETKARLSQLLNQVEQGEQVIITRHGRPVAQLLPIAPAPKSRKLGTLRGRLRIADDFDAPLPDDLIAAFEGEG